MEQLFVGGILEMAKFLYQGYSGTISTSKVTLLILLN